MLTIHTDLSLYIYKSSLNKCINYLKLWYNSLYLHAIFQQQLRWKIRNQTSHRYSHACISVHLYICHINNCYKCVATFFLLNQRLQFVVMINDEMRGPTIAPFLQMSRIVIYSYKKHTFYIFFSYHLFGKGNPLPSQFLSLTKKSIGNSVLYYRYFESLRYSDTIWTGSTSTLHDGMHISPQLPDKVACAKHPAGCTRITHFFLAVYEVCPT